MTAFTEDLLRAKGYVRGPDGVLSRPDNERRRATVTIPTPESSKAAELAKMHKQLCKSGEKPMPVKSPLASKFESLWLELGGPHLTPEHRICKDRKWRADYAHPVAHVLIELEGGIHSGGRHNRASGFLKDCEKYNRCAGDGWLLFRLCTGMVTRANVEPIISCIRRKISES